MATIQCDQISDRMYWTCTIRNMSTKNTCYTLHIHVILLDYASLLCCGETIYWRTLGPGCLASSPHINCLYLRSVVSSKIAKPTCLMQHSITRKKRVGISVYDCNLLRNLWDTRGRRTWYNRPANVRLVKVIVDVGVDVCRSSSRLRTVAKDRIWWLSCW